MNDRFRFRAWREKNLFVENWQPKYVYLTLGTEFGFSDEGIEQCTGLKDKNGKLIYENDIIDTPNGVYRVAVDDFGLWTAIYKGNPLKDVVEWSDIVKNYAFNRENVEIVILGNIHENKELLDD